MKKRVLALLLSVLMTLSLLPVSAFAADVDSAELGTEIGTVTGTGEFTDENAEPGKSYEYTIVGSDGSQQTVTVAAEDEPGDGSIYGTIGTTTGSGATYYELVTNGAAGIESGKQYLIVSASSGTGYALTKTADAAKVTITDKKITQVDGTAVFTLEKSDTRWNIVDGDGKYLFNYGNNIYSQYSSAYSVKIANADAGNGAVNILDSYYGQAYLCYDSSSAKYVSTYYTSGSVYLFHQVTEPAGPVYKITWTTDAETLLETCNGLNKDNYTEDSWNNFQPALDAANAAHDAESFTTEEAAQVALATMAALKTAYEALEAVQVFEPEISWQRTKELNYNYKGTGDLKTGVTFTAAGDDNTYPTVFWNWSDVSNLETDKTMEVWDFGTDNQYAKPDEVKSTEANADIKAATWVHRATDGTAAPKWSATNLAASVRKFAGTFAWPEGYDLDDTAALVSVNDSYYKPIYDYVANSGDQDYIDKTKGKYVLPANDDIYVFMYAKGTTLTEDNYMDYLVFWTGTSGKGVWSSRTNGNADWGKTTPSTFHDVYANRSFNGVTPNLWDTAISENNPNEDANALSTIGMDSSLLNQSNGWYTFADTAGIASVLKKNYPNGIAAETEMHIDIYCFDNDSYGGMDQLKLRMVKTPETNVSVEVRYYLDTVTNTSADNYLGSSFMVDQKPGTPITLLGGTDSNQLNYKKAAAIAKAGGANVSAGEQQNAPYMVVEKDNVINVVYTREDGKFNEATYTYDFGVTNQYSNVFDADKNVGTITNISVPEKLTYVTVNPEAGTITYTPQTVRTSETIPLTVTFNDGTTLTKYITFLPESNVMYEENMVTIADGSSWKNASDTSGATLTADKLVTEHKDAYGYTEAYADDTEFSGGSALQATLTVDESTDAATFNFTGTGFDLISECGTNTGMLLVGVKDANGKAVKVYMVDTYFCGDEDGQVTGNGILDYQVPVVRNLELPYGQYTVTVKGFLVSKSGAVVNSRVATQSLSNAAPSADEILRAAGMSEYLDADVEVSFMDDNSVLNGGTGPAVTTATPSFFSRVRSFFRGLASTQAATDESSSDIYAYIDAFRVYQPLNDDDTAYVPTEQGTTYYSLYDFVKNSVNDLSDYVDNAFVYVEYNGDTEVASIADYKQHGPQNEVYLTPGSGIAFALSSNDENFNWENATFQLSAKCIGENAGILSIDGEGNELIEFPGTATEMYYQFKPQYDETLGHYVVIQNPDDAEGILSLSALKLPNGVTAWASAELAENLIAKLNARVVVNEFVPELLTAKSLDSLKYGRNTTISIKSSTEEGITVFVVMDDGTPVQVKATNTKAVAAGKASTFNYSYAVKSKTIGVGTHTFQIYAEQNGVKSAPVTVTVEVTAK